MMVYCKCIHHPNLCRIALSILPCQENATNDAGSQPKPPPSDGNPSARHLVDALGQSLHVAGRDTSNRNTPVFRRIDGVLLRQQLHLFCWQTSVGKHANLSHKSAHTPSPSPSTTNYLVRDVIPVMLAAEFLEILLQQSSHLNDAIRHRLDLAEPFLLQGSVIQYFRSNARTMDRRVRVQGAD